MDVSKILSDIDAEITRLQRARAALSAIDGNPVAATGRRGRPKGSKNATKAATKTATKTPTKIAAKPAKKKTKRTLSPEGRKRIQEAMKRRWAERKKKETK